MHAAFKRQAVDLIRKHFPEEHIPDDRPGRKPIPARKVLEAVLRILNTGAQWHTAPAVLPELQDGASPISTLVRERSYSSGAHRPGEYAATARRDRLSIPDESDR